MRRAMLVSFAVAALAAAGCGEQATDPANAATNGAAADGNGQDAANGNATGPGGTADRTEDASAAGSPASGTGVPIQSGAAAINGQNTKIDFVGTKPDGRHDGGFSKFSGKIEVDEATQQIESISVEIQTASLWSDNEKLTGHLKSADFFNVNEHPTAEFESTSVEGDGGSLTVTGNLTMLGETQEITFPATANVSNGRLTLNGEFTIDRTRFGMDYGQGKVDNEVTLRVKVGVDPAEDAE